MKFDISTKKSKTFLILLIAVPSIFIGIIITAILQNQADSKTAAKEEPKKEHVEKQESEKSDSSSSEEIELTEEQEKIESENIPGSEYISDADKAEAQNVAEKFAQAYGNYDSKKPLDFIHNAQKYLEYTMSQEWDKNPPRRPLALAKSVVEDYETYPIDTADEFTLLFNVVLEQKTINTDGYKDIPLTTSLLVALEEFNGEWKVKGVDIRNE